MLSRAKSLFLFFLYLSTVTLGGGLAMLPMLREEFVEHRKWLTDGEMMDVIATGQSLPGVIACNLGVLLGYRVAGIAGALACIFGSVLPPFIAIVALAAIVTRLRSYEVTEHVFLGVRAAISALLLVAVIDLGKKILGSPEGRARAFAWAIAALSFLALAFLGVNAVYVLLAGGILGWLFSRKAIQSATAASEGARKP